jgi:DNA-binding MarR family transcriptional regulator
MTETATAARRDPSLDESVRVLAMLLGRVVHNLKQRGGPPPEVVRAAFEQGSLGPRHMPVVIAVALEGPMSVSEVAERIGLSVATTSLLVGELSRAGLVDRTEDERDRRRTIVTLGDEHREALTAWTQDVVAGPIRRALERLSPRARANFLEGLRILAEETDPEGPDGDGCAAEA